MPDTTLTPLDQCIHELQTQAVRDLAWCCFSAPLMEELPGSDAVNLPIDRSQLWRWLTDLDQNPAPLIEQIAAIKSTRLGIYYETLWHFYFSAQFEWELLHHNLQVQREGVTLGAFDFLCRRGSEYWHIETAVKFYLCNTQNKEEAENWHHWIGPNSGDRLDLKLSHLRQHQLPLHQTIEARAQLRNLYPDVHEWKAGLCVQGYLFSPAPSQFHPAFSNKDHGKGYWWYLQDFLNQQYEDTDTLWIILERQHWLAPIHKKNDGTLISSAELAQQLKYQIEKMKRPLLIAALQKEASTQYWKEKWRGFIVSNNWPYDSK